MKKYLIAMLVPGMLLSACKQSEKLDVIELNEVVIEEEVTPTRPVYNPSETRKHDLIHTKLDVSFDWQNQFLMGKANLTLRPYFHSSSKLVLDAKGFDINAVALVKDGSQVPLKYEYDGAELSINLDKEYARTEIYEVFIDYVAKPNELELGGSAAITSDKGLYFINPLGKDPNTKPQIWTQGETESSSCWFPTIDAPNERCTQEIYMTVEDKHVTLSNGLMISSKDNGDGTHTDYWKMDKPHAPYLFMMAVGPFSIIDDKWNDMEVDYYVEEEEAQYAKMIFGNTPEMISFFSEKLGVTYPWSKYHQVVVREYVSGAMENTTGVIFGDFMYQDEGEHLDGNYEDVVSHELFHHWFGDLVTCESWANLPLNESFATYGEYLWREHKYGLDAADHHNMDGLNGYLAEANTKQVDMIRFDYDDKEDMFDGHSYAKGGRILHMLRKYLGDDAFFQGLQVYLQENAYQAVEIHQLRLAMEQVSGEDLNWFFNQWFLASGHPDLGISTSYNEASKMVEVTIEQKQDLDRTPLYKLPIAVDVYTASGKKRHMIVIDEVEETFELPSATKPSLVNVDAEKMLLCEKSEKKSDEEWAELFRKGPLFLDRYEAIKKVAKSRNKELLKEVIDLGLNDDYYLIREIAVSSIDKLSADVANTYATKLKEMAKADEKSDVRAEAVRAVADLEIPQDKELFTAAISDKSYATQSAGLDGLYEHFPEEAYALAQTLEGTAKGALIYTIADIYSEKEGGDHTAFFNKTFDDLSGAAIFGFSTTYADYIASQPVDVVKKNMDRILNLAENGDPWYLRYAGTQMLGIVINKLETRGKDNPAAQAYADELSAKDNAIKEAETNKRLRQIYGVDTEE